ncbi:MAG: hypothetical protein Ct9H90mP21_0010 [Methanobacteriota archaeon]|nr:MAG: hypothetical protein Ct9H90mP21_0010 [Euryarchaeota archaeon]
MVYDATDKILGRLASQVAKEMISARKSGRQQRVIIINAEDAIFSGPRPKGAKRLQGKIQSQPRQKRGHSSQGCLTR